VPASAMQPALQPSGEPRLAPQPNMSTVPEAIVSDSPSMPMVGPLAPPTVSPGMAMYQQGEEALRRHDSQAAAALFKQAYAFRDELAPLTVQRLQDHLQMFSRPQQAREVVNAQPGAMLDDAAAARQVEFRRVSAEVARQETASRQLQDTN